jgi:hypothetical protein
VGDVRLTAPRVRVVLEDGSVIEDLQCVNYDMLTWERTRDRQKPKWPPMEEARMTWLTFMAWTAARRTGAIGQDMTWERFEREAVDVSPVMDDDDEEAGSPTQPGVDPG